MLWPHAIASTHSIASYYVCTMLHWNLGTSNSRWMARLTRIVKRVHGYEHCGAQCCCFDQTVILPCSFHQTMSIKIWPRCHQDHMQSIACDRVLPFLSCALLQLLWFMSTVLDAGFSVSVKAKCQMVFKASTLAPLRSKSILSLSQYQMSACLWATSNEILLVEHVDEHKKLWFACFTSLAN